MIYRFSIKKVNRTLSYNIQTFWVDIDVKEDDKALDDKIIFGLQSIGVDTIYDPYLRSKGEIRFETIPFPSYPENAESQLLSIPVINEDRQLTEFEDKLECILEEYAHLDSKGELDTWDDTDKFVKKKSDELLHYIYKELNKNIPMWKTNWLGHTKNPIISEIGGYDGKNLCIDDKFIPLKELWEKLPKIK